jgi:hypothetical protein
VKYRKSVRECGAIQRKAHEEPIEKWLSEKKQVARTVKSGWHPWRKSTTKRVPEEINKEVAVKNKTKKFHS